MFAFPFTRRAALAAILTGAASATMLANPAVARPAPAAGVRVDVGPILENSGEPTAGWVARQLPGAIEAALAGSGQAGAPVSVRIDYVLLGASSGEGGPTGSTLDQMIGEVTRGGVTQPLRAQTFYYPASSDAAMFEQANHDRVSQLCQAFAGWIAKGY